ncbi:MAG TPA: hypothetical protein DF637_02030 [Rikenellaceae bacterium]|nr:hypothetical protein [Rikenellaceae bacterium]
MKSGLSVLSLFLILLLPSGINSQEINRVKSGDLELIYFGKRYSYLVPHVVSTYHNAARFHSKLWNYKIPVTYLMLNDFEDMGHGGAIVMPLNQIHLGISPYSFAFSIIPSNERFQWLFNHEYTHLVMADKPDKRDLFFRKILLGKVRRTEEYPLSALWSYFTTPRWFSPRWYHEGIACFMETWMSGGMGRAMGYYDEMYFRSIVNEGKEIYSLIGLDTEGTTIDFQVGANSYLYGTRFITYLAYKYGIDNLKLFYNRSEGSKAFYANQFKSVYKRSTEEIWDEWIEWETAFQKKNIESVKEYPVTTFIPITGNPLGSVSKLEYNPVTDKIYASINHPGIISQIAEIDRKTGKTKKLATLDSPQLYYSTHIAYNPNKEKIYFSEHNSKYRSLAEVDIKTGKKRIVNKMTRTGDIVVNKIDNSIWGVMHDNGYSALVKIPEPFDKVIPMFTAPFGRAIFDIDISNNGELLSATMSGVKGEQSVILFNIDDLEIGKSNYKTLIEQEDVTLTQFRFSSDDRYLTGTSYFTGISNIWRINLDNNDFEMLSNDETGLFMPVEISPDSLIVLKFFRDGMKPGIIPAKVIGDANAIEFLGNMVHQNHPEVEEWSLPPAATIEALPQTGRPDKYSPVKEMKLVNGYPDIAGFKETIAAGYRMNWRDPLGVSNIDLFIALSPWSNYESNQKIHLSAQWQLWNWIFTGNYNKTHFYDLFGPTKRSRAGYSFGVEYKRTKSLYAPFKSFYNFGIFTFGDLEVLPDYQNITTPIKNLHMATATYGLSKLRKTLGAVTDEQGYSWKINGTTLLAKSALYPTFVSDQEVGFIIPGVRNSSIWVRNSLGVSVGARESGLSHFYFGGFRNNYVDWQPSEQYRSTLAFPGAEIDELSGYNYLKTMAEINLPPLRLKNVGTTWLYPTFVKGSLFGTHLLTDFDKSILSHNYFNAGVQIDFQVVLFSYIKTTWSVGYARKFEQYKRFNEQFMLSLKLLGD